MLGRISLAAGLLILLAPVLGAQATTKSAPRLRAPRLAANNALLALLPSTRLAGGPDLRAPVTLRFDPFTREPRQDSTSARWSLPEAAVLPRCPMPVQRVRSIRDSMPVAAPDPTQKYFIRVAPPGCVAEVPSSASPAASPADSTK